ncbi:MAG TPA: histidinol-phosphate transaminase [Acidobacteriaceae bacterium]|nr:histidinol-phosphate transaminase [Acidobacteriaceae bacterium]
MKGQVQPRARVASMPEYHFPLGNRGVLRLDFNENTVACSPAVLAAVQSITAADLTRYPERAPLEALAAEHLGLAPQQAMLTNGVDEAIHVLCQAYLDASDELLLPVPTYTMYEIYAAATDARVVRVQADASFRFPYQGILNAITKKTKLIAIANPNSPTGAVVAREEIIAIAEAAPHALVLVDEAYFHFYGETVLDLIGKMPNLIVARTFSKAYGLAALRLGLLAGSVENLQWARRVLSPYSVNHVALAALRAALQDQAYLESYVQEVKLARSEFMCELDRLGYRWWPSQANFVLIEIGPSHRQFVKAMQEQGILVRDRSADPGCEGLVRITIGAREQMRKAAQAMAQYQQTPQAAGVAK